jgi:tetratricopeptide (TPR) repeat protein
MGGTEWAEHSSKGTAPPFQLCPVVRIGSVRMSFRLWVLSVVLALVVAAPVAAQAPSPLDLVRGMREAGMSDLAMEYLKEIENKPISENDKKAISLERARCLLDLAEVEPDESTRTSMIGEAKEGFSDFLLKNPSHPRASEASIALARLTSIEAKSQLNRARRIEVGDDDKLKTQQRAESEAARPLFLLASKRFADAAKQINAKLKDGSIEPSLQLSLKREAFDADLAAAINHYYMADTFLSGDTKDTIDRSKFLDEAREGFGQLAKGSPLSRTVWIARAWMAEVLMDQSKPNEAENEFKTILATNLPEAEDGKRMVRFFQVRRMYLIALQEHSPAKIQAAEKELRSWLTRYGGNIAKPSPETMSFRYYLAYTLQLQGELASPKPKVGPLVVGVTARRQFEEAEKLYRVLSQSDNDYTLRASRNRMHVVRMLLGEAERLPGDYNSFEAAQMAALIQMAKLSDAEKEIPNLAGNVEKRANEQRPLAAIGLELTKRSIENGLKDRKFRIVALLERARELATDKDNVGDVNDNMLRLVYYYQLNDQPYQAAVLGEYMARTVKSTGGKSSLAGMVAINAYLNAARMVRVDPTDPDNKAVLEAVLSARKADRERAARLAHFLDEKFPNDTATDRARHLLASLFVEDKRFDLAFTMIVRVRPGYEQIASARLLEGYIATQLIASPAKDMPLPSGGKPHIFRRATEDLKRVVRPASTAREEEVRQYLSVRARLATLYLAQFRAEDKEAEAAGPGYEKALEIADEIIGSVPTFDCFKAVEAGKLNPKGMEMHNQGLDIRARAIYLRGKTLVDAKDHDWEKAAAAIEPAIAEVDKTGAMYDETMKRWAGGEGDAGDDPATAKQKANVAALARAVDRTRREIVMIGFKLKVRQGKPDEANKMLDLLAKAGGTIEENQPTLEFMARDLAAQIQLLKKAGQAAEAKAMGDGLAILLKRLSAVPNLPTASIIFLGQTLYLVEEYEEALKEFAKIPLPVSPKPAANNGPMPKLPAEWWKVDPNTLENNPDKKKFLDQIRDYRPAQLFTARCLHGLNKLSEAEALLTAAIGTAEKQGYAYSSLDFRRELAQVYEGKGAAIADANLAKAEWSKAINEWTIRARFIRTELTRMKDPTPDQEYQAKNRFFEAFFDTQRCLIQAQTQLLKGNPKLAQAFTDVGKKIADLETTNKIAEQEKKGDGILAPDVWNRFCDLLDKYPELKNAYKAAGGKFFLERPKE